MATYTVIPKVDHTGFHVAIVGSNGVRQTILGFDTRADAEAGILRDKWLSAADRPGIPLDQWTEQIMQDYCCYFLNGRGHILFPADIGAEGLEAAKQHCFNILEECVLSLPEPPRGIEIWEGDVMLFRS